MEQPDATAQLHGRHLATATSVAVALLGSLGINVAMVKGKEMDANMFLDHPSKLEKWCVDIDRYISNMYIYIYI